MKLTNEQLDILESKSDLIINAVAGSGKTSTLIEVARNNPKSRILYLAFNKSVKDEAIEKFHRAGIRNVQVSTAHSLAFNHVFKGRNADLCSGYSAFDVKQILKFRTRDIITDMKIGKHMNRLMSCFCNSSSTKVSDIDYPTLINDPKERDFVTANYDHLVKGARMFLKKMKDGDVSMTHDFYLKEFQLSRPSLDFDLILFDEGQDASGVMLDTFLNQKARKVIVGDEHQQIYRWRFAINALREVDFDRKDLTRSFRFPKVNADLATKILKTKEHFVEGLGQIRIPKITGSGSDVGMVKSKAILARSNSALIVKAIELAIEEKRVSRLHFEGNFSSYTYADESGSVYDVLNLFLGNRKRVKDPMMKSFNHFSELEKYADATEDAPLKGNIEIVKRYRGELPRLIKKLKEFQVEERDRQNADYIFSTVHKAKGMEYDEVTLLEDFLGEERLVSLIRGADEVNWAGLEEEINILYVAATRSKSDITMPESLAPLGFENQSSRINLIKNVVGDFQKRAFSENSQPIEKSEGSNQNKTYTIEGVRKDYKSAYSKWTNELDNELLDLELRGKSTSEMATYFGRTKGAIRSRLKKLRES